MTTCVPGGSFAHYWRPRSSYLFQGGRTTWKLRGILCAGFCLAPLVKPQQCNAADRVDLLLKLLQKKGIITAQEAEALNKEVEEEAEKEVSAASPVESDPERPQTRREVEFETLAENPAGKTHVELGSEGLWARTLDERFALKVGGFLMTDLRYFGIDTPQHDLFDVRRARLSVEGRVFGDFRFKVEGEFEGSDSSRLRDGYLEWTRYPVARIRAGQYKQPS